MVNAFCADELHRILGHARRGDAEARGKLLEAYRHYLRLLARLKFARCLQGKLSASDLVQETFVQADRAFSRFEGTTERELIAWLRSILISQVAYQVRRYSTGKRDTDLERRIEVDVGLSALALERCFAKAVSTPSQAAMRREHAVLLADALAALPASYREVLVQRHLEQRGFSEIARRMDRKLENVKGLWRRAIRRLKDEVDR